ncbi:histone-like nucleoid-structuring protein Lsr2 [Streptomyces sp. CFMR 7]|uniref:Lsr2 dimerization domain-containing protein n=1 Tax=Streptomyces sp. CFMR 7 TaxID=1649184 RepID=UPI0011A0D773|nr:histone-like nucleoid-structuring protein Lsr2 [Streptomyces sp. CFMR 7]
MAIKEIRVCDITGADGAQNWEFEEGDKKYGIDLLETEWDKLNNLFKERAAIQEQIQEYVEVAEDRTPGQPTLTTPAARRPEGPDAAEVRKWAKATNHLIDGEPIPERGRVPKAWKDAYVTAQEAEKRQQASPQAVADKSDQEQPEPSNGQASVKETEEASDSK